MSVSVCVCEFVRKHTPQELHVQISTDYLRVLSVAVARFPLVEFQYVMYFRFCG